MGKKNKKELKANAAIVKKPNRTIMITNGDITATQHKAYNVLLYKAQQDLALDSNKSKFVIAIAEIKEKAGIHDTNNKRLKEDLEKLMSIRVKCMHENNDWDIFVLLSRVSKQGDLLEFVLPDIVRDSLINKDYYTTLDLIILRSLDGKYAIIFYEWAIRYKKVEIPRFDIDEFIALTGTESYRDFTNIRQKCIEPGIKEVNEKTDVDMDYEIFKTGRKVTAIKFSVKQKPQIVFEAPKDKEQPKPQPPIEIPQADPKASQSQHECKKLYVMLPIAHRSKKSIGLLIDKYFASHGFDYVKRNIEYANKTSKTNYRTYLAQALEADWGIGFEEDREQAQKFNFELKPGMKIQFQDNVIENWKNKVFEIEEGICIHPNGLDGGCLPEGELRKGIIEGFMKIVN